MIRIVPIYLIYEQVGDKWHAHQEYATCVSNYISRLQKIKLPADLQALYGLRYISKQTKYKLCIGMTQIEKTIYASITRAKEALRHNNRGETEIYQKAAVFELISSLFA